MRILSPSIAPVALLLPFGTAIASEGLFFGAIYECAPLKVTEAVASACASARPDLAKALVEALQSWKGRNAVAAIDRERRCYAELRATLALPEEPTKASEALSAQVTAVTHSLKVDINEHPDSCTSTLKSLSSMESDLAYLPGRAK